MSLIKKIGVALFVFTSNLLAGQNNIPVKQFDKSLNQFLNVRDFCLSADGQEAYFSIQSPAQEISQLARIRKTNSGWSQPVLLPFCDAHMYLEPSLSPDGRRLFFVSDRPLQDSVIAKKDFDIWYVERNGRDADWSEPKNMGSPINSELNEFYPSISENNNMYFTLEGPAGFGKDDIYFCKWANGQYSDPVLLSDSINTEGYEFNAFISQKEDFLIFSKYNEADGQGSGDLYIAKKNANGKWLKATNLGIPINTKYMEYCPFYDQKNEILYFTSKRNTIEPRNFRDISDFITYVSESKNGLSKIYMTSFKIN